MEADSYTEEYTFDNNKVLYAVKNILNKKSFSSPQSSFSKIETISDLSPYASDYYADTEFTTLLFQIDNQGNVYLDETIANGVKFNDGILIMDLGNMKEYRINIKDEKPMATQWYNGSELLYDLVKYDLIDKYAGVYLDSVSQQEILNIDADGNVTFDGTDDATLSTVLEGNVLTRTEFITVGGSPEIKEVTKIIFGTDKIDYTGPNGETKILIKK